MDNELRSRWDYFCGKLWAKNRDEVFKSLDSHYSEGQRFYHNWNHILDCLRKLEKYCEETGSVDLFAEAAIWFHDVIYNTRQGDNEEQSAAFFERSWKILDPRDYDMGDSISRFIVETQSHPLSCLVSAQVLFDVDLSVLAAPEKEFDEYDEQIRAEYYWVPDEVFNPGRVEVLAGFFLRDKIYQTKHFSKYETRARENLKRIIKKYGAKCP